MEGKLLLTVEVAAQVGTDLLIAPFLPADQYEYDLDWIKRIKIVKPDDQVLEKDADFGRAFDAPNTYILLLSNTQADEVPIGSQIWI
jgi:hypothetical protein